MPLAGELLALLTAVLWSASSFIFAAATKRISSLQVNILRLLIAEGYFAVYLIFASHSDSLSLAQIVYLSSSGIVGLSLGDTFLFRAFQEVGARVGMLLMTLAPAIAAVLAAIFLHEQLRIWVIIGMTTTLIGVALVIVERTPAGGAKLAFGVRGVVFGLLGAAGQGAGLILAKLAYLERPIDGFTATSIRILAGLLLLVAASALTGRTIYPREQLARARGTFTLIMIAALLGSFLGISASFLSVAWTSVGVASTIMATVPVLMLPVAWIVYKESIHWRAVAGAITAVAGVSLLFLQ